MYKGKTDNIPLNFVGKPRLWYHQQHSPAMSFLMKTFKSIVKMVNLMNQDVAQL